MKFSFKKIASVLASAVMLGSTIGIAAAANYPAPFVTSGGADVTIVAGAASPSLVDSAAAVNIVTDLSTELGKLVITGGSTPTGGDSVLLEKGATKFHLGKGALDIVSGTLTDDDLGTVLKDGRYLDNDNDANEYTQKIELANFSVSLFDDSDYKEDNPTVGIAVSSSAHILNYTLDFSSNPNWADLANTNIEIMGKNYFISSVTTNDTINLLDSANTAEIAEGDSTPVTVGGKTYTVSIGALSGSASSPQVKLIVDGETTNSLSEGNAYQLSDGTYVGIKDISMRDVAGTAASVEFSIGTGKIELRDNLPVRINEAVVNGLTAYFTSSSEELNTIVLEWDADDDMFATEDSNILLPELENVKISFDGMNYPAEETSEIEKGSNTYMRLKSFPLKDGAVDIDLMYGNGTLYQGTGKEATKQLLTISEESAAITFDPDIYQYFVATYDDGNNAESYLMKTTSFGVQSDGTTNTTDIQYYKDGSWISKKTEAVNGDTVNLGSVSLDIGAIHRTNKEVAITGGTNVYFDRVVSKEGLKVFLPIANVSANYTATGTPAWPQFMTNTTAEGYTAVTTYQLGFLEETRTEATTGGNAFNVTFGWTSNKATVSDIVGETPNGGYEIEDTDVMRSFVYGALATEISYDTSGDQDSAKIIYHGGESYGKVYITETAVTFSSDGVTIGDVVTDGALTTTEKAKNLIVVGGSCVNTVAEQLLGGKLCGNAFTASTGIGTSQFLVKVFDSPYATGKIAMLVAGYEAADTNSAVTYVTQETPIATDVGTVVKKTTTGYVDVV